MIDYWEFWFIIAIIYTKLYNNVYTCIICKYIKILLVKWIKYLNKLEIENRKLFNVTDKQINKLLITNKQTTKNLSENNFAKHSMSVGNFPKLNFN